jgi:hypothetical protein
MSHETWIMNQGAVNMNRMQGTFKQGTFKILFSKFIK